MIHKLPLHNSDLFTLVDEDIYERYKRHRIYINGDNYPSVYRPSLGKAFYLHRLVVANTGRFEVDHINGDKLDNRRANLRVATRSENQCNRPVYTSKALQYKGVSLLPSGSYNVQLHYANCNQRKNPRRGTFKTLWAAIIFYNLTVSEEHGDYASVNKVPGLHALYYPALFT